MSYLAKRNNMEGYEHIINWYTPSYSYIEGDKCEHRWVDSQNCWYYLIVEETDEETGKRFDGKNFWIIEPYKPKGVTITEENYNEIMPQLKWLVTVTSEKGDRGKEWDFENHCVKTV